MSRFRTFAPQPSPRIYATFFNWATIFVLSFGNLTVLDFQARCMAAINPRTAQVGCLVAGCLGIPVGVAFAFVAAVTRYYYGPDSIYAEFEADTCSRSVDSPTCAQWPPDPSAVLRLLTHEAPTFIGG